MNQSDSAEDLKIFEDFWNLPSMIRDKDGKKGKSSFVKWLYYNHPLDIARLSFGTASQLRSAVFNMGRRKCYIIDLRFT